MLNAFFHWFSLIYKNLTKLVWVNIIILDQCLKLFVADKLNRIWKSEQFRFQFGGEEIWIFKIWKFDKFEIWKSDQFRFQFGGEEIWIFKIWKFDKLNRIWKSEQFQFQFGGEEIRKKSISRQLSIKEAETKT